MELGLNLNIDKILAAQGVLTVCSPGLWRIEPVLFKLIIFWKVEGGDAKPLLIVTYALNALAKLHQKRRPRDRFVIFTLRRDDGLCLRVRTVSRHRQDGVKDSTRLGHLPIGLVVPGRRIFAAMMADLQEVDRSLQLGLAADAT